MKLIRHPGSPPHDLVIDAYVERSGDTLHLRYTMIGAVGAVVIPAGEAERSDGLWRSTSFEAFVRGNGSTYAELNLAPSGGWAAYRFDDYREGASDLELESDPAIRFGRAEREAMLSASVAVPAEFARAAASLGLSVVIEDVEGNMSYWALAHAPGDKPDFHHPDCFVARLP